MFRHFQFESPPAVFVSLFAGYRTDVADLMRASYLATIASTGPLGGGKPLPLTATNGLWKSDSSQRLTNRSRIGM